MKNLRIGTRISSAFSMVITVAVALGLFAYGKVGGIDGGIAEMKRMQSLDAIDSAASLLIGSE